MLGIDCGSAFTKVALIEPVAGRYRLIARGVARTTSDTHIFDGISRACSQIEAITGRQLFAQGEPIAGDVSGNRGVEAMAVSLTCQPALQVLATNRDAAAAAERELCRVSRLSGGTPRERLEQVQGHPWDAIVGRPEEVAEAASLLPGFDGPETTDPSIADALESLLPRRISGGAETIQREIASLSLDRAARSIPGTAELAAASTEPLCTGPAAMVSLARLIAQRFRLRLALADCGASAALLALAGPNLAVQELRRDRRPERNVPLTTEELKRSHRLAEEALSQLMPGLSADLLVGTGAVLSGAPRWGQAVLMLLNGVRPRGVIQLAVDSAGIVSQIAALAERFPDVASEVLESDGLTPLGTAICPEGSAAAGQKALDISWRLNSGEASSAAIEAGELWRIPLPAGTRAEVSLFPAGLVDVGLGQPGASANTQVEGGRLGLIVDARLSHPAGHEGEVERSWRALEPYA